MSVDVCDWVRVMMEDDNGYYTTKWYGTGAGGEKGDIDKRV